MSIEAENTEVLKHHAKTFYLASLFLPSQAAKDASNLYRFAREVDDIVDENPKDFGRKELARVIASFSSKETTDYPFVDFFRQWTEEVGMDKQYPEDLLQGVGWDLDNDLIETEEDFYLYCYRVAGVVGLMMCFALGVREKIALPHAIDLGLGMQMTNICRDVIEDLGRARVYVPRTWLGGVYLNLHNIKLAPTEALLLKQVVRILQQAEEHYKSASLGMVYIPVRARFAILVASRVYRAIGLKILKRPKAMIEGRVYLNKFEKLYWLGYSLVSFFHPVYWVKSSTPRSHAVPDSLNNKIP